jgi:elongation factor P
MATANDIRKGMAIKYNGEICIVLETQHRTPGNLRAFVQATIRQIKSGKSSNVRFSSTENIEVVPMNSRRLDFSYQDQSGYHFMDPQTYETVTLQDDVVGEAKQYLVENVPVVVQYTEDRPVQIELPPSITVKIVEAAEGVRGDTATNVTKPAKLENGMTVQVPLFIKEGELVKVDTRTGQYMSRA